MNKTRLHIKIITITILMLIFCMYLIPNVSIGSSTYVQQVKPAGIENFPKSYQAALNELHKLHPNWTFTAIYTGIDWNELLKYESGDTMHGRSVIYKNCSESDKCWCGGVYDYNFYCASKSAVAYYIDPRNFLTEKGIFQFEELSYNKDAHTLESIEKAVKGSFLDAKVTFYDETKKKNVEMSYAEIILEAAKQSNMSPFHIKSKIIQEVGWNGSNSTSGTCKGYEGLYNFFNYGAYDSGDPIENGLIYARDHGWTNQYISIVEGAKLIANSYINVGQNTSYFFKFDVVTKRIWYDDALDKTTGVRTATTKPEWLFQHQYMTNIGDPASQSPSVFNMYASNGILDTKLNFIIPIYDNMPNEEPVIAATPTPTPTPMPTPKPTATPVVKEEYKLDAKAKQITLTPGMKIATIVKEQKITNYNITDAKGNTIEKKNEILATGYKLNVLDKDKKTITATYTLIMKGDINGDGNVTPADYVNIKNSIMGTTELNKIKTTAADIDGNGSITPADYVGVKNHIMNVKNITLK